MTPLQANTLTKRKRFTFALSIQGITLAHFQKVSGLKGEADVIEDRDGMSPPTVRKSPGLVKYDDVTLEQGETDNQELYAWWQDTINVTSGAGKAQNAEFYRDVLIVELDRNGVEIGRYELRNAWVKGFETEDWDASSSENQVQRIVLAHEGFHRVS